MPEDRKRTTERDRRQEEKMIEEAERGPTAVDQGNEEVESGADSARGMQTGAKYDLTRNPDGKPAKGQLGKRRP
jgi:hypothetical protein